MFLKYALTSLITGLSTTKGSLSLAAVSFWPRPKLYGALNYQTFVGLVGQPFKLVVAGPKHNYSLRMLLTEVVPVALTPENDQFYVVFQINHPKFHPDGVYHIHHATAGGTQLLLQPIGNGMAGNFCRADFNLLL